jgi:hypothetical protein
MRIIESIEDKDTRFASDECCGRSNKEEAQKSHHK